MKIQKSPRFVSNLTRNTLALIMAGGRGERLKQLTQWRAKPAVPFGGKFRIIDFPLSNCINSGIRKIGVLTQYKSHSLILHVQRSWGHLRAEFGEFVELLPAQQRIESTWYAGTADAIYQNLDIIRSHTPDYVLILAGDHIYKMDYGAMLAKHVEQKADITVGCIEVPIAKASAFGVMEVDKKYRIQGFVEKPADPQAMPGSPGEALCSMGIYIFNTDLLFELLIRDADSFNSSHDFGKNIIPYAIEKYFVFAYQFSNAETQIQNYWRDVGTVDAFWEANLELIGVTPELNLYDDEWPIWTHQEQLPPAKFIFDDGDRRGMAVDSMVSGGCIISGASVRHSLLFSNVTVDNYSKLDSSVILPDVTIGKNCRIYHAVIDKGCEIPDDTIIGIDNEEDKKRFYVSPNGVVLVTPEMMGQVIHYVR
ncbi:MAG: glucose-1-phosphate adenylyltransferase [Gammaproteobacteria bacterium]|nr:glucose-1-phosphate adenylyltransferase [Gammaproteobacteria bacterium]